MATVSRQDMKMIRLDNDVHAELTNIGRMNESYSDVVRRLIKVFKESQKK